MCVVDLKSIQIRNIAAKWRKPCGAMWEHQFSFSDVRSLITCEVRRARIRDDERDPEHVRLMERVWAQIDSPKGSE